jgi:hypothetical protein
MPKLSGGYKRTWPDKTPLSVGLFIQAHLPGVPHQIYIAYKDAVQSMPNSEFIARENRMLRKDLGRRKRNALWQDLVSQGKAPSVDKKPRLRVRVTNEEIDAERENWRSNHPIRVKRKVCSYNSFMHYIYMLKRLGLIESTGDEQTAAGKGGSPETAWHEAHPSNEIRESASGAGSSDWATFQVAYRQQT